MLDLIDRAGRHRVRVGVEVTRGAPAAQQVPALVEFFLDLTEPGVLLALVETTLLHGSAQPVFLVDQLIYVLLNRAVLDDPPPPGTVPVEAATGAAAGNVMIAESSLEGTSA